MNDRQQKRPWSFWLLADNTLVGSQDTSPGGLRRMKARLVHTLILNVFNQRLLISDAQLIDNPCLRLLIRDDNSIRNLFPDQLVGVAVRADGDGNPMNLNEVIEGHKRRNKYLFDHEKFGEGNEIELVNNVCEFVPFNLDEVAKRYQRMVLWMFGGTPGGRHLPKALARRIHGLASEELEKTGELGWIFFYQHLQQHLSADDWANHRSTINQLAETPYHTGLPTVLDADPVYADRHAKSFELARGIRQQHVLDEHSQSFRGKLGLAAFEQGISLLETDDIISVLDSDEARGFAAARDGFDGTIASRSELINALELYVYSLESRIVARHQALKQESADGNERRISVSVDQWKQPAMDATDLAAGAGDLGINLANATGAFAEFMSLSFSTFGLARSIVDIFIVDRIRERESKEALVEERQRAASQSALKDEMMGEMDGSPSIEHEILRETPIGELEAVDETKVDLDAIETLYP